MTHSLASDKHTKTERKIEEKVQMSFHDATVFYGKESHFLRYGESAVALSHHFPHKQVSTDATRSVRVLSGREMAF